MAIPYKPDRYTSVAPYLIVDGAERTLRFLKQAFDGRELRRFDASEHRSSARCRCRMRQRESKDG